MLVNFIILGFIEIFRGIPIFILTLDKNKTVYVEKLTYVYAIGLYKGHIVLCEVPTED